MSRDILLYATEIMNPGPINWPNVQHACFILSRVVLPATLGGLDSMGSALSSTTVWALAPVAALDCCCCCCCSCDCCDLRGESETSDLSIAAVWREKALPPDVPPIGTPSQCLSSSRAQQGGPPGNLNRKFYKENFTICVPGTRT